MAEDLALSVVIPCRNDAHFLRNQLEALSRERAGLGWEVVVSDNGSTDGLRSVVEEYADRLQVRVVDASERAGRAFACNAGVQGARGRAVAFVDADDEVGPGYVPEMMNALARHDFVAARVDTETLNPAWVRPAPFQVDGLLDHFGFLPFGLGCSLGVTRRAFNSVGGFREDIPFAEDVDFCWRLQLSGVPLVHAPRAILRYRYRDSLSGLFRQSRGYGLGQVALYRAHRHAGMPRRSPAELAWEAGSLVYRLLVTRSRLDFGLWLHRLGYNVGRVRGCFRYRVFYL